MAKDLVKEAYEQIEAMKEAATDTARNILIEAMSTDLKAAVSQAMSDTLEEESNTPSDYHAGKKGATLGSDRVGDEIPAKGITGDDLTDEGDGPAILETEETVEEDTEIDEVTESDIEEMLEADDDDEDEDMMDDDDDDDMEDEEDTEEGMYEASEDDDEIDESEEVIEVVEDEEMTEDTDVVSDLKAEVAALRKENKRYEKALIGVKNQMDEVNLFNARLAAATDLFRNVTLTKQQKERVVEHFDKASTIGEVKRVLKALKEGYNSNQPKARKARVSRPNVQSVVTEATENTQSNTAFERLAKLAGTL